MIKVKEFSTKENNDLDEQINDFITQNNIEIVDVKYNTFLDTSYDIIMSFALLIYKEESEIERLD